MTERKNLNKNLRGRNRVPEKPKDIKKAVVKLLKYIKPYRILIIFAIILASLSSILSIIGPDKLSNLTDEISKGIEINQDNLTLVMNSIQNDIKNNIILTDDKINSLSDENKVIYNEFISNINKDNIVNEVLLLNDDIKILFLNDSIIDNVKISKKDKLILLNSISKMNENDINDLYKNIESLDKDVYNLLVNKMDMKAIKSISLTLLIMYLLSALFNYTQNYLMVITSNNFAKSLRSKIIVKINKLALKYFDKNSFGDILSRITNDVDTINMSLHNSLGSLVSSLSLFIGSIIMMLKTNVIMAISGMLSSLIGFIN